MKRIVSVILMLMMVSGVVYADAGIEVEVAQNTSVGNEFIFEIEYKSNEVSKGDSFEIQLPFDMNIDGRGIVDVEDLGSSNYRLTFLDNYINVKGKIGGKKTTVVGEELKPLIVDGRVITNDYDLPTTEGGTTVGEREQIYKGGKVIGDRIWWSVVISADKYEHMMAINVIDEIGDGHELDVDSVRFAILDENMNYYGDNVVDEVLDINNIFKHEIDFYIKALGAGETININYYTDITDKSQSLFENQLIIEGKDKISEGVYVEDWSDIDADKPEKPTEPETPAPEEPEPSEPEDPKLPQVGESYFKIEYILGTLLLAVALITRKRI